MKFFRIRLLTNILMLYTLLAGAWWSYLLNKKNEVAFQAERELLMHRFHDSGADDKTFWASTELKDLVHRYTLQQQMIAGEGIVLMAALLLGLWWINYSVSREAALDRQQNNFLLSVTHELKSPIASIRLVLETLRLRQLEKAQSDRLTGNALAETTRLQTLVENMLLAARIEGAGAQHREVVQFNTLIDELLQRFQQKFPDAKLICAMEPDIQLLADPYALTTIVLNLLENAVKYSPPGKAEIVLRLNSNHRQVVFEVADQGIGIPDSEKKKVFDKFYRMGNEDTRRTKGTGLGLYIVKGLVEAQRGSVEIRDNLPSGTVFTIFLPKK